MKIDAEGQSLQRKTSCFERNRKIDEEVVGKINMEGSIMSRVWQCRLLGVAETSFSNNKTVQYPGECLEFGVACLSNIVLQQD